MKIGLKPTVMELHRSNDEKQEEVYFVQFQAIPMKKSDIEAFVKKMNEENEVIVEIK